MLFTLGGSGAKYRSLGTFQHAGETRSGSAKPELEMIFNFLKNIAIIFGLGVALVACESNPTPYTPTVISKPGNAKLFVYWPGQRWGEKSGQAPEIQLDGVPVGLLRYKRYIEIETAPGTYELTLTGDSEASNWNGPERAFPARLVAGENVFVRLSVKYDQETNRLGQGAMSYSVTFLPRAEADALLEMDGLKKVAE
jgi:hypothetical protein